MRPLPSAPLSVTVGSAKPPICRTSMDVSTWNYTAQDEAIRHMGPVAEDFYDAFGLGESESLSPRSTPMASRSPRPKA